MWTQQISIKIIDDSTLPKFSPQFIWHRDGTAEKLDDFVINLSDKSKSIAKYVWPEWTSDFDRMTVELGAAESFLVLKT